MTARSGELVAMGDKSQSSAGTDGTLPGIVSAARVCEAEVSPRVHALEDHRRQRDHRRPGRRPQLRSPGYVSARRPGRSERASARGRASAPRRGCSTGARRAAPRALVGGPTPRVIPSSRCFRSGRLRPGAEAATAEANRLRDAAVGEPSFAKMAPSLVAFVDDQGLGIGRNGSALMRGDNLAKAYPSLATALKSGRTASAVWINRERQEQLLASFTAAQRRRGGRRGARDRYPRSTTSGSRAPASSRVGTRSSSSSSRTRVRRSWPGTAERPRRW